MLAALAFAGSAVDAQTVNRIAEPVDTSLTQALPNHHPLWASAANSEGAAPADLALNQLTLVLSRSPGQQAAFEQLLADQQNPASPDYHHWLTPGEVGQRFGLSDQDIATITAWLQSQGLRVNWVAPSRIFIGFGGTAADVGHAFQTEMHYFSVRGARKLSVNSDPMVPTALIPAIRAIRGLYTIDEQPNHSVSTVQSDAPQLTNSGGSHFIGPADFDTIYDVPASYSGAGVTVGIVAWSRVSFVDLDNFRAKTGLNFPNPTQIVPTAYGGVDPGAAFIAPPGGNVSIGGQSEATLDVVRVAGTAPGANILLMVAAQNSSGDGIGPDAQYMIQTTPVPVQVISISFGGCESANGASGVAYWDSLFQQAATEGISVFVSSGDSGASGCDDAFKTPPTNPRANSPNYICSSSYATCVGGTEFADVSMASTYWNPSSSANLESARSYIPEGGWNESTATSVAASGGGVSAIVATPSWQTGTGVPAARSGRYTPDVSFSASQHDPYFACMAAISGGGCVGSPFGFVAFSGTSASAPGMAGVAALLDQKLGVAQGNLNQKLYSTASAYPGSFHDVTVNSSGVAGCDINTSSMCNNSIPGANGGAGEPGFLVGYGYDEVTGLGSLDVQTFLNDYTTETAPAVTVSPFAKSITTVQGLIVTISISGPGNGPTPSGSITLTSGSYSSGAIVLSSGSASINIPAGSLAVGTDLLSVSYAPDAASSATYSGASGLNSVTVSLTTPTVTVSLSSSNITTAQPLTVTIAVSGGAGSIIPTGTVGLSGGGYSTGPVTLVSGSATITLAAGLLTIGTDTLTAIYNPDTQGYLTYLAAQGSNSVAVTATAKLTPTVTVTPPGGVVKNTIPLVIAIVVSDGTSNPTPTGSVTLISGSYSSSATALSNGGASISIPSGSLRVGTNTLTVAYAPDSVSSGTYNNTSGSTSVYVTQTALDSPLVQVLPSTATLTTTGVLTVSVIVNGATGTVTLTSGVYTSAPVTLVNNSASIVVPVGTLPIGSDTVTVTYIPDAASSSTYTSGTGVATVTVTAPPTPTFTVSGTGVSVSSGATTGNSSTITVAPANGFTGGVALTAAVTSSPAGAQYPPTLSFGSTSPVSIASASSVSATLIVSTTASHQSCTAADQSPRGILWYARGGAVLTCLLLFGIAPHRRKCRTLFGMALLLAALTGGMLACGGGSQGTACDNVVTGGTTAGSYTITLTGTSGSTTAINTIALTVQ